MSLIQVIEAVLARPPILGGHSERIVADGAVVNEAACHDVLIP